MFWIIFILLIFNFGFWILDLGFGVSSGVTVSLPSHLSTFRRDTIGNNAADKHYGKLLLNK